MPPTTMPDHDQSAPTPTPKPRLTICPYCGARTRSLSRCEACRGLFDPLSRQATQNAMGPWFLRDETQPHRPGCSYETLVRLVDRGQIRPETVIRGPSTLQFWTLARWCPGVAHLMGTCHSCGSTVDPTDPACARCGAPFRVAGDRQHLGLGEVRFVPGRGSNPEASEIAAEREPTPQAGAVADPSAVDAVTAGRVGRLERELAGSRRWGRVWLAALALVSLALAAVLIAPLLDLEAGPFGAWMRTQKGAAGVVGAPDLDAEPLKIQPGAPAGASPGIAAADDNAPPDGPVGSGATREAEDGESRPRPEGGEQLPPPSEDLGETAQGASPHDRLRRLR